MFIVGCEESLVALALIDIAQDNLSLSKLEHDGMLIGGTGPLVCNPLVGGKTHGA